MPDSPTPNDIRARLKELGYLKNPLDRFVFGGGSTGGALKLALGAGARGALIAGPLLAGFGIVLLGEELARDEKLGWFLAFTILFGLVVFLWVIAQALLIHLVARRSGRSLESLPVLIGIAAAAGLLLPALLWLLASGQIQSAALRGGLGGALLAAVALLLAASLAIFSATRAADLFAAGNLDFLARGRGGNHSLLLGVVFLGLIGGVLARGRNAATRPDDVPRMLARDPKKAKGNSLRIIAVDGVHSGDLSSVLGPNALKLTEYSADPDLIVGWLKIQTGHLHWQSQGLTGYRAFWGGQNHDLDSAPGRFLRLLSMLRLAGAAPLPGEPAVLILGRNAVTVRE